MCVLKPLFHVVKLRAWDGVDVERRLREVLENEDHIKLLEAELYALQGSNLDIRERNDEEWGIREMDKTLRRRLQPHVRTEWHTLERQLAERNVRLQCLASLSHM